MPSVSGATLRARHAHYVRFHAADGAVLDVAGVGYAVLASALALATAPGASGHEPPRLQRRHRRILMRVGGRVGLPG